MNKMIDDLFDVYQLLFSGIKDLPTRKQTILFRRAKFTEYTLVGFEKVAFDTRRINQETDYIPRRGLQNYHRSEKFISDSIAMKIEGFKKLATLLDQLKMEYGRNPEWHDSYTRVLASAVHRGLRTIEADNDFSDAQPSMASLDYLEELMFVRYRMTANDLMSMSEDKLRETILSKDELLVKNSFEFLDNKVITPSEISKNSYDDMVSKMLSTMAQVMTNYKPAAPDDNLTNKLFAVKATPDTPEIERTVTITIKDKIKDKEDVKEMAKVADIVLEENE